MTLGGQLRRPNLPTTGARWCEAELLPECSVDRFLTRERTRLFPSERSQTQDTVTMLRGAIGGLLRAPAPAPW